MRSGKIQPIAQKQIWVVLTHQKLQAGSCHSNTTGQLCSCLVSIIERPGPNSLSAYCRYRLFERALWKRDEPLTLSKK